MRGAAILAVLAACLPAQRALLDTLPPGDDVGEHRFVGFGNELEPWALPGDGMVFGFARIGERLWIARGSKLHCVEWPSRREVRTVDAPPQLVGICADGRFLYGVAGTDLHVLDALAGRSVRSVAMNTVWPPSAITMHGGKLHVLVDKTVMTVDPATGAAQQLIQLQERAHWLAGDGARLWCGDSAGCRPFAGDGAAPDAGGGVRWTAGTWTGRTWPCPVYESAAAWIDGRLLVALEHGDSKRPVHEAGLLTPVADLASQRLHVHVHAGADGKPLCVVDGTFLKEEQALLAELRKRAADRTAWLAGADGKRAPMPVVIDADDDVKVRDVAKAWDLALAAGFTSVHCPPLEAWVRRQQAAKAPPDPAKK